MIDNGAISAGYFGNLGLNVAGGGGVAIVTVLVILIGLTYIIPWYTRFYVANSKSKTAQREADVTAAEKNLELDQREQALAAKKNTETHTPLQLITTPSETQQLALENTSVQSTVPLSLTAAGQLTNDEIIAILREIPGRNKKRDFKKNPNPAGPRDYITLQLVDDVVKMMNSHPFTGSVFRGGTRKHKKRIGVASKHHKKRRRGTKKPSKRRRATRRKRR